MASGNLRQVSAVLKDVVAVEERQRAGIAQRCIAGHGNRREGRGEDVEISVLDTEGCAEVFAVIERQRHVADIGVACLRFQDQLGIEDMRVIQHPLLRLLRGRPGERNRAARIDTAHIGQRGWRVGGHIVIRPAREDGVRIIEAVVHTRVRGGAVLYLRKGGGVGRRSVVRRRVQSEVFPADRIDLRRGEHGTAAVGEVTGMGNLVCRGHRIVHQGVGRIDTAIALIIREEECPIAEHGPADAAAELVLTKLRLSREHSGGGEEVACVEHIVPDEFIRRTVELVGAGAGDQVHNRAGGFTHFRRRHIGDHAELRNRFHRGPHPDGADGAFVIVHALHHLVVQSVGLRVSHHG